MSAKKDSDQQKIAALRALGHDEAADDLAMLLEDDAKQRQEPQPKVGPPGIPMLSDHVGFDRQKQAEAQVVAEALRSSGVNRWVNAGPLVGGSERGDHR